QRRRLGEQQGRSVASIPRAAPNTERGDTVTVGALTTLATETSEAAREAFLDKYPHVDAAAITSRWDRAFWLWTQDTIRPILGVRDAYTVRCQEPQKTRPGEPTSYTVTMFGQQPRAWCCDCGDALWRSATCKHQLAAYLYAALGSPAVASAVPQ